MECLHSHRTAKRNVRNQAASRCHDLRTVLIKCFFAEASINIFGLRSYVFHKWPLEEMTFWYQWSCTECLRWWMMILYCIRLHSSWIGIVWLQERYWLEYLLLFPLHRMKTQNMQIGIFWLGFISKTTQCFGN